MKVLDFGAGTGALVMRLRDLGFDIDGLESSGSARRTATVNTGSIFLSHPDELPVQTYDVVVMVEVIEHLSDPPAVLRAIRNSLKPCGLLYVSTPNVGGFNARLRGPRWREARKDVHLVLFDFPSLGSLLGTSGFDDVRLLRFSPLTSASPLKCVLHRALQTV